MIPTTTLSAFFFIIISLFTPHIVIISRGVSRSIGIGSERGFGHLLNRRFIFGDERNMRGMNWKTTLGGENQEKRERS